MRLVRKSTAPEDLSHEFAGTPLSVVFADGEAIATVATRGEGAITLEPPFHVSDEDCYLVLPDDVGLELVDIMRDGDLDLLHESLRDGLLVVGTIGRGARGMALLADKVARPRDVIRALPYAAQVVVGDGGDAIRAVNALPHVRCTLLSALIDDDGLEGMLSSPEHVGASWNAPAGTDGGVDPTFAWSKRAGPGRVGVELALFLEYEELVVLLRPVELVAA